MSTTPKIEQIHPASLIPYTRNAKKHDSHQVQQIADSIAKFGFNSPVLIDHNNGIIAGHARTRAAIRLGLESIPAIRLSHLSEMERRAYIIADNKLSETGGGWNDDLLRVELAALSESEIDELITGFDADEIADLIETPDALKTDPDSIPDAPAEPITKPGDLWILGKHRLLCGDSTREEDVRLVMNGQKASLVFTDPPYGVNVKGGKGKKGTIAGDLTQTAIPFSFELAVRVATTSDARLYFCGGENNLSLYAKLFDRYLSLIPRHLIWVKNGFTMKPNGYHNQYEIIFYGYKESGGGNSKWFGPRTEDFASDVWQIKRDPSASYLHPTQKPIAIPTRAITNSSEPRDLVYEPFGGSGSTLIACEQLGRICYAIELDPIFCDVIKTRWENATGQKAVLHVL